MSAVNWHVRKVRPGEAAELWQLFYHTVRQINARDYTPEQLAAWAPDVYDDERWQARIAANQPYVCLHNDQIVGFADVQATGYIDHFFVHHQWQGCGVAKRLFEVLQEEALARGIPELTANVSLTARPFFESRGFEVVVAQEVEVHGVRLKNFQMRKQLPPTAAAPTAAPPATDG
jgi:putative acetyltransferase